MPSRPHAYGVLEFLGVPVPSVPFPRVNDAAEFQRRTTAATLVSWVVLAVPVALVGGVIAALVTWLS